MTLRSDRRNFLKTAAAGGVVAGLGDLAFLGRLRPVSAAEAQLDPEAVRFQPEIEPLVRLLEETPRDRLLSLSRHSLVDPFGRLARFDHDGFIGAEADLARRKSLRFGDVFSFAVVDGDARVGSRLAEFGRQLRGLRDRSLRNRLALGVAKNDMRAWVVRSVKPDVE